MSRRDRKRPTPIAPSFLPDTSDSSESTTHLAAHPAAINTATRRNRKTHLSINNGASTSTLGRFAETSSSGEDMNDHVTNDETRSLLYQSPQRSLVDLRLAAHAHSLDPNTGAPYTPLLRQLPAQKRWRDWWTRGLWTAIMVTGFMLIIASGHLAVVAMVVGIQAMVFKEVIHIAHVPSKEKKLPWFRLINCAYFLYGETLFTHFKDAVLVDAFLGPLSTHHRFACFGLYCLGFVFFVTNLKKGHYKFQFVQFFWTHMTLLVVVFQSHFIIDNILEGLVWFFLPVSLVICNDVFAYVGGFFFGRTRLIALSPKKTWEGFFFGFLCTLVFSVIISRMLILYDYMICPTKDIYTNAWSGLHCDRLPVFVPARYTLTPAVKSLIRHIARTNINYVTIAPLQWHALLMACFASFIAPFGGFFASGFKRAFKLKDFGSSIPGHGGFTDRMDCQFIMGLFSFMYYTTFIKTYEAVTASTILQSVVDGLGPKEQVELFGLMHDYLLNQGLIA